ncbi:sperm equatorial segment protein 1 isoform X2 [Ornithorhynchus anatinus]|nr:sperm equatorial segment protein 1 isoform X2 [Ornithorhynchus anatinus]XP_039768210.1 sperm equatorial segment protein 1 isoform X2 [Ornithorhynchus anatinus]
MTKSTSEEKTVKHFVNVLQEMMRSIPTPGSSPLSTSLTNQPELTNASKADIVSRRNGDRKNKKRNRDSTRPWTTNPNSLSLHSRGPSNQNFGVTVAPSEDQRTAQGFTTTSTTPFWSLKPGNNSVILHTNESLYEKNEGTTGKEVSGGKNEKNESLNSSKNETVPHRSKSHEVHVVVELVRTTRSNVPTLPPPTVKQLFINPKEILASIGEINKDIQKAPVYAKHYSLFKDDIESVKKALGKSLALEAAAENSLKKFHNISPNKISGNTKEQKIITFINFLYEQKSNLTSYLHMRNIPSEVSEKAAVVFNIMKRVFCGDVEQRNQKVLKKLLKDDIKLLNLVVGNHSKVIY